MPSYFICIVFHSCHALCVIWDKNGAALCTGGVVQCLFVYLQDKDSQSLIKWELWWCAAVVSRKDFADLEACFSVTKEMMGSICVMRQWSVYIGFWLLTFSPAGPAAPGSPDGPARPFGPSGPSSPRGPG